uniref:Uncharacterized protein n=1 Tax=Aegilops tauschii TaxID=37682 RepID=M8BXM5_AEGTA
MAESAAVTCKRGLLLHNHQRQWRSCSGEAMTFLGLPHFWAGPLEGKSQIVVPASDKFI